MWRGGFNARSSRKQRKTALQELRTWDATSFDEILQGLDAYRGIAAEGETGFQINIHGTQRWPAMLELSQPPLSDLQIIGIGRPTILVDHSDEGVIKLKDVDRIDVRNLRFRSFGSDATPDHAFALDGVSFVSVSDIEETEEFFTSFCVDGANDCDDVVFERCYFFDRFYGDFNRGCFINNRRCSGITFTAGSDNRFVANYATFSCSDSASGGNNAATGNTGGASYTGWTGTGSVAGDNT